MRANDTKDWGALPANRLKPYVEESEEPGIRAKGA